MVTLIKVDSHRSLSCIVFCIRCGAKLMISAQGQESAPVYADLQGKPFVDYYCSDCRDSMTVQS